MTPGDETNDPGNQQKSNKICLEKLPTGPGGDVTDLSHSRLEVKETCVLDRDDYRNCFYAIFGRLIFVFEVHSYLGQGTCTDMYRVFIRYIL